MLDFVLTDIHGHIDQLTRALAACEEYAAKAGREHRFVFLGDYIDRGPDSKGVVTRIMQLQEERPNTLVLLGNHEEMMVDAWKLRHYSSSKSRRQAEDFWLDNGGKAALASFNDVDVDRWPRPNIWIGVDDHLMMWMSKLPVLMGTKHRLYVHAGLLPRTPADEQLKEHCLWIRDKFLRARPQEFKELNGLYIVHGHTPTWEFKQESSEPEVLEHRCNLDTGTHFTGVLTVGVFDNDIAGGPVDLIKIVGEPSTKVIIFNRR